MEIGEFRNRKGKTNVLGRGNRISAHCSLPLTRVAGRSTVALPLRRHVGHDRQPLAAHPARLMSLSDGTTALGQIARVSVRRCSRAT
jgi:hypothetical protein